MTTLILKVPEMDEDFSVCIDASKEGLGRVLMKDGRVITYTSRKLTRHEESYTMHDFKFSHCVFPKSVETLPNWMENLN
jgi:hypothetical protein